MNPINRYVQIVLVDTSHPGNIGSVARAMKNMGLANLILINPKKFRIKKQKTTRNYPIKGLDYRNYKRGPEIQISFKN